MTQFFGKFPTISYNSISVRDILQRVKVRNFLINNALIFHPWTVRDGETPEIIAHKLYGSTQYSWLVRLCNEIIDPYFDWPLSYPDFISTMRKRYNTPEVEGIRYSTQTVHHYEDNYGNVIDEFTFNSLPADQRLSVNIYDWEMAQNEAKRSIRLLDKRFLTQIDREMDKIMAAPIAT